MSLHQHVTETAPGVVGTTAVGGLTMAGFIGDAIPALQFLSLLTGIAVAIITFVYYWRKVKRGD